MRWMGGGALKSADSRSAVAAERERILRAGGLHWFHWVAVAGSLVVTLLAWSFAKRGVEQRVMNRFEREADQTVELITERLQKYEDALWGGVGAIQARGGGMTLTEWRTFAHTLQLDSKYPGINGIGVILSVPLDELPHYLENERRERPDFEVHPPHDLNESLPITYVEPVEANRAAVGLDMAHEENRYAAAQKARDTGLAQITGPIVLVQDAERTPGFLFYAPYYREGDPGQVSDRREDFLGMVYAPFVFRKLMAGVLSSERRHVNVQIADSGEVLYDDIGARIGEALEHPYERSVDVPVYGRTWSFRIRGDDTFLIASKDSQPLIILFGGLAIDSMLLGLFLLLSRANRRAVRYADAANAELVEKTATLAEANEHLEQFAYAASHDLRAPLRAIDSLSGWIADDLEGFEDAQTQEHLGLLRRRVGRMDSLLTGLLDFARAGQIDAPVEVVNVSDILDEVTELLDPSEGFVLRRHGDDLRLETVAIALQQVLLNLIGNALKHHDRDKGLVVVSFAERDPWIEIEVSDDGPGIPPERREEAFRMFRTLRRRDEVEGSGIGLAMVRRFVSYGGGSVDLESNEPRGTRVVVRWPLVWPDQTSDALLGAEVAVR